MLNGNELNVYLQTLKKAANYDGDSPDDWAEIILLLGRLLYRPQDEEEWKPFPANASEEALKVTTLFDQVWRCAQADKRIQITRAPWLRLPTPKEHDDARSAARIKELGRKKIRDFLVELLVGSPEQLATTRKVIKREGRRLVGLAEEAQGQGARSLKLGSGGFFCGDQFIPLGGRPMKMLTVLLDAPGLSLTADALREKMRINDISVTYPEQVVIDTASELRKVLRNALGLSSKKDNPVPSKGSGDTLAYRLEIPKK